MVIPDNQVMLKEVRLSFPELFEATQYKGAGAYKFSAQFLIVPGSENDKAVRAAILHVAKAKWPKPGQAERLLKEFEPDKKAYPYMDGARREYAGYEGVWALTAKRDAKQGAPIVIGRQKQPLADDGRIYAGCYVNGRVEFWAQDGDTKGIRCTLLVVQFWKAGDAFGGGAKPSVEGFEEAEDLAEQGDPLA